DRQPIGEDRPLRPLRQVVVQHAKEAGREEECDGVVAVPPLHHRILHARPDRIALGRREGGRDRQIVDDVEHGHDQDEGHVVPVRHVDVRLLPARQRADVEEKVGHPHDDQPQVGVPFGFRIFLRLGDADEIAAHREHAEKVVAEDHEPGAELPRQAGPRRRGGRAGAGGGRGAGRARGGGGGGGAAAPGGGGRAGGGGGRGGRERGGGGGRGGGRGTRRGGARGDPRDDQGRHRGRGA